MAEKTVATNRHALHEYAIIRTFEAGLELKGTEVKSLRAGQANLKDSFAKIENGQVFLYNMHIAPYEFGNIANVDPMRTRRLLLHKKEIGRLVGELSAKHLALIPLKLYFKGGFAKVELAVAKGKKLYDKREAIRHRESERELRRIMKNKR